MPYRAKAERSCEASGPSRLRTPAGFADGFPDGEAAAEGSSGGGGPEPGPQR
jgi:hypothetical protein